MKAKEFNPADWPFPPLEKLSVRYADGQLSIIVSLIYKWHRGDVPAPVMSASSGPKDYVKNQVYDLFTQHQAEEIILVRAAGPPFFLMRIEQEWFDATRKPVLLENRQ